ncbi:DNA primase [Arthrobacter sp. zg-Y1171]|uniref:DNA primase n=1 Tax=Arthrobacter sp. zg-Y1171 TaxID=2964610 RepID=UPI002101F449|nr:DNA primase [Arthrobacter sp. zg-Y1171]MCQ1996139.1 DNA primase [Arthrobacter sp. zg-Y1171]UWX82799.1 DNA primase [Arthrobacter sp. zg-Y1171]
MAGLIKREDIDEVRLRTDIKAVIDGYVTLKSAGIGSFKGLCPFHDERSPSFHVRPQVGTYHCFGCGESGDVISFVQKMDHGTFSETVEKLAARLGYELHYEDGGTGPRREDVGKRQRLLDAHKVAAEFFRSQLGTQGAAAARNFLQERGFDPAAAEHFGVGYAPQGWDSLLKHLTSKGFTREELAETGMFSTGSDASRFYDRFRGRLIWPIRDLTGAVIGFGARKLYEDDQGPKYLNTPETPLYKKSQVLYGIDLAKRDIAKTRQLVVVEGYTDVMACHLAGITTAVATCGTAFGTDHIKIARRLLSDDGTGGEVIFTFDGDAAGQKAALRAFEEDQRFTAQTYVAVDPNGMDPCDIRQTHGDSAVAELISSRRPLFEFAIRSTLRKFDLNTVEGRVSALRAAAPVVADIRDPAMRPAYARELAGWLGTDVDDVSRAVNAAAKRGTAGSGGDNSGQKVPAGRSPEGQQGRQQYGQRGGQQQYGQQRGGQQRGSQQQYGRRDEQSPRQWQGQQGGQPEPEPSSGFSRPNPNDPAARMERQALEVALQQPGMLDDGQWERFKAARFTVPAYVAVHDAIRAAGEAGTAPAAWVERVREELPEPMRGFVSELAVTPLPARDADALALYCRDILNRLFELQVTHLKAEKLGQLQRLDPNADPELFHQLNRELMELEMQRRALRGDQ